MALFIFCLFFAQDDGRRQIANPEAITRRLLNSDLRRIAEVSDEQWQEAQKVSQTALNERRESEAVRTHLEKFPHPPYRRLDSSDPEYAKKKKYNEDRRKDSLRVLKQSYPAWSTKLNKVLTPDQIQIINQYSFAQHLLLSSGAHLAHSDCVTLLQLTEQQVKDVLEAKNRHFEDHMRDPFKANPDPPLTEEGQRRQERKGFEACQQVLTDAQRRRLRGALGIFVIDESVDTIDDLLPKRESAETPDRILYRDYLQELKKWTSLRDNLRKNRIAAKACSNRLELLRKSPIKVDIVVHEAEVQTRSDLIASIDTMANKWNDFLDEEFSRFGQRPYVAAVHYDGGYRISLMWRLGEQPRPISITNLKLSYARFFEQIDKRIRDKVTLGVGVNPYREPIPSARAWQLRNPTKRHLTRIGVRLQQ